MSSGRCEYGASPCRGLIPGPPPAVLSAPLPPPLVVRRPTRGNGREAAKGRNRTWQKCSSPHGEGPLHVFVLSRDVGAADGKARKPFILTLERGSADSPKGFGYGPVCPVVWE